MRPPDREKDKMLAVMPESGTNGTLARLQKQGWDVDVTRSLPIAVTSVSQQSYDALLVHKRQVSNDREILRAIKESFPDLTLLVTGDSVSSLQPMESLTGGPSPDIAARNPDTIPEPGTVSEETSSRQSIIPSEPAQMRPILRWMRKILSPQQLYGAITDYFYDVLEVTWVSLLLTKSGEDGLKEVSTRGCPSQRLEGTEDVAQLVGDLDLPLQNPPGSEGASTTAVQVKSMGSEVFLAVPLVTEQKVLGVLCLGEDSGHDIYSNESLESLCALAGRTAECLDVSHAVYEIRQQALMDRLTGVYNRRYFETALEKEVSRAERSGRNLGLAILDVDHFKDYNDAFGHPAGDQALKRIAQTMKHEIRDSDSIYRYGGEEFAVVLPDTGADKHVNRSNVREVIERVRQAVARQVFGEKQEGGGRNLTLSGGIAIFQEDAHDARGLIRCADRRLYEAKRAGRNRVEEGE